MTGVQSGEYVRLRDRRRGIDERFLDAGLEDRIERLLLPLERPQPGAHDLAERAIAAGTDALAGHTREWAESDGDGLGGAGGHAGII